MDTYGLVAMEPLQPEVRSRERSGLSWDEPAIRPWPASAFQPGEGGKTGRKRPLAYARSMRDNRCSFIVNCDNEAVRLSE